ncbi:hypothetical protein Enr13x_55540 [Stieleria neptunia]|uniref:Uncharacterized protein n=1 Tax=Stieleria neptunia TaxID=2527979 RepID=A0A518HXU2_9BACT|nr:hypothetical protein Enr13x_55540 [Stieleria neptunia]
MAVIHGCDRIGIRIKTGEMQDFRIRHHVVVATSRIHAPGAAEKAAEKGSLRKRGRCGKGVRYQKCEAPCGPFGFWYLTPFPLRSTLRAIWFLVPDPFSARQTQARKSKADQALVRIADPAFQSGSDAKQHSIDRSLGQSQVVGDVRLRFAAEDALQNGSVFFLFQPTR